MESSPPSFFKLNTDGSARGNPGMALAGGLLKDPKGAWAGSFNRAIGFTHSLAVELWGLRDGLTLAKSLNIKKLMIEIDAQAVVDIIKSHNDSSVSHHPYIGLNSDCKPLV